MEGDVSRSLRMAEWALGPTGARPAQNAESHVETKSRFVVQALKSTLVAVPLEIALTLSALTPPWGDDDVEDEHPAVPTTFWTWPEFAVNGLDVRPGRRQTENRLVWERLLLPRLLVVKNGDEWVVEQTQQDGLAPQYIFISFTNESWGTDKETPGWEKSRSRLEKIAELLAEDDGCNRYWIDFRCCAEEDGEEKDKDVNRFCDVIRGAKKVIIVLPGESAEHDELKLWGSRMWCLPEGLLASGNNVHFYNHGSRSTTKRSKVQMTADVWKDSIEAKPSFQSIRLLAEHFSGVLTLSRLEIFPVAVNALANLFEMNKATKEQRAKERRADEQHPHVRCPKRPELAYGTEDVRTRAITPS